MANLVAPRARGQGKDGRSRDVLVASMERDRDQVGWSMEIKSSSSIQEYKLEPGP